MEHKIKSIRPFIGARDYELSRQFYKDLGFEEVVIPSNMSYFKSGDFGFYLQDAYVKDWVDNTMLFMEVEDLDAQFEKIKALSQKYKGVRLSGIVYNDWGNEFFLHDPSGILWHIGVFLG
ncbi:glyoxalase [uncultured Cyclobacterium sp.]|mgnify:CR=1 FL=1|uniref:glyoxalase n=1 Tax=uncultured Cyclobacterium sp. TaxID=453820 RepID=UPI0030EE0B49|tara:strand:- start:61710 stop:62069 length:360 start_codon:yes stop_codon:yes gene_type:complete